MDHFSCANLESSEPMRSGCMKLSVVDLVVSVPRSDSSTIRQLGDFDYDQNAVETYNRNHQEPATCRDIHDKSLWQDVSELDKGVLAITPCISFSLAGKRDGWSAKGAIAFSLMIAVRPFR